MMRNSLAALSLALAVPSLAQAQGLDAINRAKAAAATASQRNQQVDQQAQQATQQGKPAAPPPAAPGGAAAAQGGASQQGGVAAPAKAVRPLPKIQPSGGASAAPSVLPSDIPGTHSVSKGETLWGIAQRYLNDPYLWPEIYRLNTDVVEDPRWIYPGEVLRLPTAVTAAAAPAPAPAQVSTIAVKEPDAAPAAPEPRIAPEEPQGGATVFSESRAVSGTATRTATIARSSPIVRSGEFTSAPFVTAFGGPAWSGRITDALAPSGVDYDRSDRAIQLAEQVSITPPSGAPVAVGTRYLVVRRGATIKGYGEILVPTGVIQVEVAEAGKAPVARVKQIFEPIRPGQGLLPYERLQRDSLARPTLVANGPLTSVVHIENDPALPTIQAYVMIGTRGIGAVRPGDVFALVREATKTSTGATVPEEVLAMAQVVRVTPQAATAVITGQKAGGIKEGTPARLAARMPAS